MFKILKEIFKLKKYEYEFFIIIYFLDFLWKILFRIINIELNFINVILCWVKNEGYVSLICILVCINDFD